MSPLSPARDGKRFDRERPGENGEFPKSLSKYLTKFPFKTFDTQQIKLIHLNLYLKLEKYISARKSRITVCESRDCF